MWRGGRGGRVPGSGHLDTPVADEAAVRVRWESRYVCIHAYLFEMFLYHYEKCVESV
jgi:hypothetical protein